VERAPVAGERPGSRDPTVRAAPDAVPRPPGPGPLPTALLAAGVLAGVVLRAWALTGSLGRTDSDEVLSGLMARHLAADGWGPFLWGQSYGGSIELGPLAVSTAVFGSTAVGLRLPVVLLAVANSVLVWRVARRILPAGQAQVAGLVSWLGPPTALWYGVREMLFYQPTVTFGLVTTLFVLRIIDGDTRTGQWVVAGLAAGMGFWTSPNAAYFVVPAVVMLAVHRRAWWRPGLGRGLLAGAAAGVVGALPWLVHNALTGFDSLRATSVFPVYGNYVTRLGWFAWFGLPGALGTRETFTYDWILGAVGVAAGLGALAALAVAARRGASTRSWDTIALATYPLLFAAIPFGPDQPNMKYQFFLTPMLAVALARLAASRRAAAALLAVTVAVSAVGLSRIAAVADRGGTPLLMEDLDGAVAALDRLEVSAVWGDYWIVYRLDWHTDERIVAAPAVGIKRYEPFDRAVREAGRSAWVVERGADEATLRQGLDRLAVPFRSEGAGAYVVIVPERPVAPEELRPTRRLGR
jgi:4-amino-4-deoxy-L-arabinose transferase-like glycosyltransferase